MNYESFFFGKYFSCDCLKMKIYSIPPLLSMKPISISFIPHLLHLTNLLSYQILDNSLNCFQNLKGFSLLLQLLTIVSSSFSTRVKFGFPDRLINNNH